MEFVQATFKVEKEKEFEELKGAIGRAFAPENVERLLKQVNSNGLRIRDLHGLFDKRVFEKVDAAWAKSGGSGQALYQTLPVSDQSLIREFYLSRLEEVKPELRTKFQKLYQYY